MISGLRIMVSPGYLYMEMRSAKTMIAKNKLKDHVDPINGVLRTVLFDDTVYLYALLSIG